MIFTVCILSYNRKNKVLTNISKLIKSKYFRENELEILVIDNCSSDNTIQEVKHKYSEYVTVLKTEKNIGISGWNVGIRKAKGEYLILLDDDAFLSQSNLDVAKKSLENKNIGIYSFRVVSPFDGLDFNKAYPTGNLSYWGCGVILRKKMLDEIGAYDPDFFFQAFELDLSIRAANSGWGTIYDYKNPLYHMTTIMTEQTPFKFYYSRRNLIVNVVKHFSLFSNFKILPRLIKITLSGRRKYGKKLVIKSILDGIKLGIKKRKVISKDIENRYINNFIEFSPIYIQNNAWNEGEYWKSREEYYPDYKIIFNKSTEFSYVNAKLINCKYQGYDWLALNGGDNWFSIHKPPTGEKPACISFDKVFIQNNSVYKAIVSLVDDRSTPVEFNLDIFKNENLYSHFSCFISPDENGKEIYWDLKDLASNEYTFSFYSTSINENDQFEYSTLSVFQSEIVVNK